MEELGGGLCRKTSGWGWWMISNYLDFLLISHIRYLMGIVNRIKKMNEIKWYNIINIENYNAWDVQNLSAIKAIIIIIIICYDIYSYGSFVNHLLAVHNNLLYYSF